MSRNGGVRYVYQFPDMSRVCIGPFKHWMRVKELPAGLSAQEAYEMARFASQFEAKSGVEYKTDE